MAMLGVGENVETWREELIYTFFFFFSFVCSGVFVWFCFNFGSSE